MSLHEFARLAKKHPDLTGVFDKVAELFRSCPTDHLLDVEDIIGGYRLRRTQVYSVLDLLVDSRVIELKELLECPFCGRLFDVTDETIQCDSCFQPFEPGDARQVVRHRFRNPPTPEEVRRWKTATGEAEPRVDQEAASSDSATARSKRAEQAPENHRELSQCVRSHVPKGNVFRKHGDSWIVVYKEKLSIIDDLRGLQYIHYLLEHPHRRFRADVLSRAVEGIAPSEPTHSYGRMTQEELADEGLSLDRAPLETEQEAAESLGLYKSKIEELDAEIEEAERCHDIGKLEELNKTRNGLISLVSSEYDVKDRPRETSDPHKADRQRISTNISRALDQIKQNHSHLYEHLDSALKRGTSFSYSPTTSTAWAT